jgi:hypothetical protein
VRGNRGSAELVTTTTHVIDTTVTEVRFAGFAEEIAIIGEDRANIEAELRTQSNGYDDEEAQRLAKVTTLKVDTAGTRVAVEISYPRAGSQRARLTLKIPSRLRVILESNAAEVSATGVAGVQLASSRGRTRVAHVAGDVTGTHRNGELIISDSGSVKLTANGSDVTIERITREIALNMRSGDLKASELGGPVDLDTTGTDITLDKLEKTSGILRINATSGSVTVKGLRTEGRIDARGCDVDVVIDRAAPLAIYSEGGAPVEITPPAGGYQLDAVAANASITVPEGTLDVTTSGQERRATGPVNGGGPTITVRTGRGAVVLRAH